MKKVYNLIGIAQRAGKVSSGTMAAKTSLLRRRAFLLIMSKDISINSRESLESSCTKQKIPWIMLGNKYDLGTSMGKAYRVAVTINDRGMAEAILDTLKAGEKEAESMGVVEWQK